MLLDGTVTVGVVEQKIRNLNMPFANIMLRYDVCQE